MLIHGRQVFVLHLQKVAEQLRQRRVILELSQVVQGKLLRLLAYQRIDNVRIQAFFSD